MNREINYKIMELLRNKLGVKELEEIISKYYLLGYIGSTRNKKDSYIENILRSNEITKEIENTFELIEKENKELQGVFKHLKVDRKLKDSYLYNLISTIKEYNIESNEWKYLLDHMLNKIYESSKITGESATPTYLNKLGIEILEPQNGSFYDGACGVGLDLTQAYEFSKQNEKSIDIYGQEINDREWAICKIRLFINGVENSEIKLGNTLSDPLFIENGELKTFDNIMMNFPFSANWKPEKEAVERDTYNRFIFGKPPISSSEWLFISHIIKSLNKGGKAIAITSSGTLFRGAGEEAIRKNILALDCIESVISLPGVMTTTAIPINMVVINMNKSEELKNKILFINAETMFENINRGQKILTEETIKTINDIYKNKEEIEEISTIVDIKNIKDSNLLATRNVLKTEIDNEEFGKIKFKKDKLEKLKECKTINDIGKFYRGINVVGDNIKEDIDGEYKIINFSDVKNGEVDINNLTKYIIKNNARIESYMVEKGDILISSRGANTKICVIESDEEKVLISQNFIGLRLKKEYNPNYIKAFLESPLGQYLISSKQVGTSIITLNSKDLKQIPIIVVPKEEQLKLISGYKQEKQQLEDEINKLQEKLKQIKLGLYEGMGVSDTFEII